MTLITRMHVAHRQLNDLLIARSILSGSPALASVLFAQSGVDGGVRWWIALSMVLVALTNIPFFLLSARGHRGLVSWAMVFMDACLITYLVHNTSGTHSAVSVFYLWPIIAAGLLLGARAGYLTSGLAAVLYLGLAVAEAGGWEPRNLRAGPGLSAVEGLDAVLMRVSGFLLIALLAGMLSNALLDSNARLTQTTADLERELSRMQQLNHRLTILDEVGRILGRIQDLETLLPRALERIADFLGVEAGMIVLFAKDRNELKVVARRSLTEKQARDLLVSGLPTALDTTRENLLGSDEEGRPDGALPVPRALGYEDALAAPLRLGTEYLGNLYLFSASPDPFDRGDLALMDSLCSQLAIAIKNVTFTRELKDANENLQNLDRLKSDFLATMSHELRTPLTSIIGYSDMLLSGLSGDVSDKQRDFLRTILNSGEALLDLINDILDLTKIEAGKLELNLESVHLGSALVSVLSVVKPRARDKNLQITTYLPNELPTLWVDSAKLNQILLNLLTNAIKFTPETGRIGIEARPTDDGFVQIEVNDTGIGIPPEHLDSVFERFTQIDTSSTRSRGGTGLGLAITRDLIELHQGSITVQSQPGGGSQFTFTLPQAGVQREARSKGSLSV